MLDAEQQPVPEHGGGRHGETDRHGDEARRHDHERVERTDEEGDEALGGEADPDGDGGDVGERLENEEDALRVALDPAAEPDSGDRKQPNADAERGQHGDVSQMEVVDHQDERRHPRRGAQTRDAQPAVEGGQIAGAGPCEGEVVGPAGHYRDGSKSGTAVERANGISITTVRRVRFERPVLHVLSSDP